MVLASGDLCSDLPRHPATDPSEDRNVRLYLGRDGPHRLHGVFRRLGDAPQANRSSRGQNRVQTAV